jgi:hypothetical protein
MKHGISPWRACDYAWITLGSPQSREGDERKEAKLDAILRQLGPNGERTVAELDRKYPRT